MVLSLDLLILRLRSDLEPAFRAFLHIGVIPVRIPAIIPIIGWSRRWRRTRFLPLNINGRRSWHRDHRRIAIIGRTETVSSVSPTSITSISSIAAIVARSKTVAQSYAVSAISPTRIESADAIKAHAGMVMMTAMVVPAVMTAMVPAPAVTAVMPATPIVSASATAPVPIRVCKPGIKPAKQRKGEQCCFDRHVSSCPVSTSVNYLTPNILSPIAVYCH
jgi:hypothetical protein